MANDFGSFSELESFQTGGFEGSEEAIDFEKNLPSFGSFEEAEVSDFHAENSHKTLENPSIKDIQGYAQEVLNIMLQGGIPPTPANYRIYFEKMLDGNSKEIQEEAGEILEKEQTNIKKQIALETKVLQNNQAVSSVLKTIASLYKNLTLLQSVLQKRIKETNSVQNANILQNLIIVFEQELQKIAKVIEGQIVETKECYDHCLNLMQSIEEEAVFNLVYSVFNLRYLQSKMAYELEEMKKIRYKSSLVLIKTAKNLDEVTKQKKNHILINKGVAKILKKATTRVDVIAYCEGGIFAVLLSHSDKESAKRFANKISEMIGATSVFLEEEEVTLGINCGILELNSTLNFKDAMKNANEALKKAIQNNVSYVCYGEK
ncbi:diguanylate cyclase domain-containing protein [Helicobacter burdigaliensis]|uniref:diguanylate cyclase domain-containing protein n=1 Tax=Helicobacter burdigaliensis TaxID=2315334 RepID=UPI000EF7480B|nr:diguanylate cyclase [Helicobacter burdigaliensis]